MQPVFAAAIIGIFSFFHDQFAISPIIRDFFHLVAALLMFQFLPVFIIMPWWAIALLCMFVIGVINAYSFVDRVKGTTSFYSILVLGALQYVNILVFNFVERDLIWIPMFACILFALINYRKMGKCSSGEVGSATMSFWITFLSLRLILDSGNPVYILFLAIYGVDYIWMIIRKLTPTSK